MVELIQHLHTRMESTQAELPMDKYGELFFFFSPETFPTGYQHLLNQILIAEFVCIYIHIFF